MKKKAIVTLSVAILLAVTLLVPSVQAFAVSALSVLRVGDTKTIQITVNDIEEIMTSMKDAEKSGASHEEAVAKFKEAHPDFDAQAHKNYNAEQKQEYRTLTDVSEFKGFSFNLPKELKGQKPELMATDEKSKSFTLDTAKINEHMIKANLTLIDEKYNGTEITINTPSSIMAKYENLVLFATQGVYVDAPEDIVNGLWENILQMPFLTENLRTQLSKIDPLSRDIYLPVIQGIGRETTIGSSTGYIYSVKDFEQFAATLPESITSMMPEHETASDMPKTEHEISENATALIWTKDGVLYCLIGNQSDSELSAIARSIR